MQKLSSTKALLGIEQYGVTFEAMYDKYGLAVCCKGER